MRVHNVHSRELAASSDRVGDLIDELGSERDAWWPVDRWPTTRFELDGPLQVGTCGRQGQIRHTVQEYAPGRRLVLRFDPGLGLVGTHRLEAEPLGEGRTRLSHTLDCTVQLKLLAPYPILIRQHDALVEDLFDRAELILTGRVAAPSRWPATVRIANAIEFLVARVPRAPSPT